MQKKGFTLVELIAVISILALIMILTIPNITSVSKKTGAALKESKIKAIETSAEKYGNASINDYRNCIYGISTETLDNECKISLSKLIEQGFLQSDKDNTVINPETNKAFEGHVYLCYNPKDINIYATYKEKDESFNCTDISVNTKNTLKLVSNQGIGYTGGNPIEIKFIKTGTFLKNGISCSSTDNTIASCQVKDNKLLINITPDNFTEESKDVVIELNAKYDLNEEPLQQIYKLKVYNTSLKIKDDTEMTKCLESGQKTNVELDTQNTGDIDITSSDSSILSAREKSKNELELEAKENTGLAKIKLKENNGNKELLIEKRIFKMQVDSIPTNMLLNNEQTINIDYGGNESVTIKSDKPEVIKFYTDKKDNTSDIITLNNNQNSFTIVATGKGSSNITIESTPCYNNKKFTITVSSFYAKENNIVLYEGGNNFTTDIISEIDDTYECLSTDSSSVKCQIENNKLILTPLSVNENVDIDIIGTKGGQDKVTVNVLPTSINLVNNDNTPITKVCANKDTGVEEKIFINTVNGGNLSISNVSENIVNTIISNNELIVSNKNIENPSELEDKYQLGYNTGITKITVNEDNGKKSSSIDYYVYSFNLDVNGMNLITGQSQNLEVTSSTTGPLKITSSDPSVASATITNPTYSYEINRVNKSIINIQALSTGTTTITVEGSDCGKETFEVNVEGKKFSINLQPGNYTYYLDKVVNNTISCTTEGSNDTCTVKLPDVIPQNMFIANGYSETIDDINKKYDQGDEITLSETHKDFTLYGNSIDTTKPVCYLEKAIDHLAPNETTYVNLICAESGSGTDSKLTKDSISFTDSKGEIVSTEDPIEIISDSYRVGYTYRIGIKSTTFGEYVNIKLNENQIVDKFNNGNEETSLATVFIAEYRAINHWSIGKENPDDIKAILYSNQDLPEDIKKDDSDDLFTLILYGTGETKDYGTGTESENSPWIEEGLQEAVTNIIIKDDITAIGESLFYSMFNLRRITLPEGISEIKDNTFAYDKNLESLVLPSTTKTIRTNAFKDCFKLSELKLNEGLTTIGKYAFSNHSIKELWIPASLEEIGLSAFEANEDSGALTKLEFEENSKLTIFSHNVFKNHNLSTLTIPSSIIYIHDEAFAQKDLESSTLENLIFEEESKLLTIDKRAFYCCKIKNLNLPETLKSIGDTAFVGLDSGITSINIGANIQELGVGFAMGENIQEFNVDENNEYYTSLDGIIYTKDMTRLVRCPDKYTSTHSSLTIPSSVQIVDYKAFGGLLSYEEPKDFTLNIPDSVTDLYISTNFFGSIITEFNVSNGNSVYSSIDGVLYSQDKSIIYRIPSHFRQQNFTIPSHVTEIANFFGYANQTVETIEIPDTVHKIGFYALATDPNIALKTIYLNVDENTEIEETMFSTLYIIDRPTYVKNIYVKNPLIMTKIQEAYSSTIFEFNLILEDSS